MHDGLIAELEAKAWQSSSRRNSAGSMSRPRDHVCWRARDALQAADAASLAHRKTIARLTSAVLWALGEGEEFPAWIEDADPLWWRAELKRRAFTETEVEAAL